MPRRAGVLLHPTSLPQGPSIGSLGDAARAWIDWLDRAGFRLWQILPLAPQGTGWSPYSSWSSQALSPWLIDLQDLARDGLLTRRAAEAEPDAPSAVDFQSAASFKSQALDEAAEVASRRPGARASMEAFRHARPWVDETASFALATEQWPDGPWWSWPSEVRLREERAIAALIDTHRVRFDRHVAVQWMAHTQWQSIRDHAASRRIQILGDLPMYCDPHSADVWCHGRLFDLTEEGEPASMAGVPPDLFSDSGQLWRSPTYRWDVHAEEDFDWWCGRIGAVLEQVDVLRLDHFRGFEAYWSVPRGSEDARPGQWLKGPGQALFAALERRHGAVRWVAEDLGLLDERVHALRDGLGAPGISVLQFGFGADGDANHRPGSVEEHRLAVTGTHDNDTVMGWWSSLCDADREEVSAAIPLDPQAPAEALVREVLNSRADTAIVPIQDLLGLDSSARMNVPGTAEGNWSWRVPRGQLTAEVADRFATWTAEARR